MKGHTMRSLKRVAKTMNRCRKESGRPSLSAPTLPRCRSLDESAARTEQGSANCSLALRGVAQTAWNSGALSGESISAPGFCLDSGRRCIRSSKTATRATDWHRLSFCRKSGAAAQRDSATESVSERPPLTWNDWERHCVTKSGCRIRRDFAGAISGVRIRDTERIVCRAIC